MVKDSRVGECLWVEWSGDGYEPLSPSSILFFTHEHINLENEIVRRALASALQRDGIAQSLGDGYRLAENGLINYGYAGYLDGEIFLSLCSKIGVTDYGDEVEEVYEITWIEI
jgi:ABC-type transport system substrate-binding protein